jgi:predicted ArsR family transcriptional regulator
MRLEQGVLDALLKTEVSPPALKTALAILALHPNENKLAYFSTDDVAGILEVSTKSAERHLSECVTKGALVIVDGAGQDWVCYGPPKVE